MGSRRTVAVVVCSVLVYLGVSVGMRVAQRPEVVPFFTWDLFTTIPAHVVAPAVYLNAVGGRELDRPVPLLSSGLEQGRDYLAYDFGRRLGHVLSTDPGRAAAVRRTLEANRLGAPSAGDAPPS